MHVEGEINREKLLFSGVAAYLFAYSYTLDVVLHDAWPLTLAKGKECYILPGSMTEIKFYKSMFQLIKLYEFSIRFKSGQNNHSLKISSELDIWKQI